jgi:hypothetical protein
MLYLHIVDAEINSIFEKKQQDPGRILGLVTTNFMYLFIFGHQSGHSNSSYTVVYELLPKKDS